MENRRDNDYPDLTPHIQFLGRIYTVLGWLGLFGAMALFFSVFSALQGNSEAMIQGFTKPTYVLSAVLLVCWSILLLNFAKDLTGEKRWSTGIVGYCIGILNLFSVPIGTAVGGYTLWILIKQFRSSHHLCI